MTIREQNLARALILFVLCGALVFGAMVLGWTVLSGPIGRRITQPLKRFAEVTQDPRHRRIHHRVPATRVAEVQRLSEDFNAMLDVIQRRTSSATQQATPNCFLRSADQRQPFAADRMTQAD